MLGPLRTAFLLTCVSVSAVSRADDTIRIGAIYPLTGVSASAGNNAKAAIEVGEDIVNSPHPGLETLPLGGGKGLSNLQGAKIDVIFADHLGNPSVGQSQTLRLITRDKVIAMIGADQSSVSFPATAIAERFGIPFLVADSSAPNITGRGFKWVFRTTPIGADFAKNYVKFLSELKASGRKVDTLSFVFENTDYGASVSGVVRDAVKEAGFNVVADIGYPANATDVAPQVLQLRDKHPDVAIFISSTAEAILYIKTMKTLDYKPPLVIADDSGFSDPAFVTSVGNLAQGVVDRSAWSIGEPGSPTAIINDLYKAKTGQNLDDASGRIMQGFFVLADAINRAGSTEPVAIQKALTVTDLRPDQLMTGYRGVKFDDTGQNILASSYLIQLQGKDYVAIWPGDAAAAKLELPYKGWQ